MSSPEVTRTETTNTAPPELTLSHQEQQEIEQLQRLIKEYSTGGMVAGGAALGSLLLLPAVLPAMAVLAPIVGVGAAGVASWLLKSKLDKEKLLREILDKIQESTRTERVACAADKNSTKANAS
jgi:predicted membrane-bound spermidine synthase